MILKQTYTFINSSPYVIYFIHMGKECVRVIGGEIYKSGIHRDNDYYIKHNLFKRNYKRTVK